MFTTPLSVDIETLYTILGLSAQGERWVRQYKQCQITARDIQQRLQMELHLLQVHYNRVKTEFDMANRQITGLQQTAQSCLGKLHDNFSAILSTIEEKELGDSHPPEMFEEFLETIESQRPIGQNSLEPVLKSLDMGQVPSHRIAMDHMDVDLPASYTAMQEVCLRPVASLESKLAKRL